MSGHDDAAGWRDLADQLSDEQRAQLEYWDQHPVPGIADDGGSRHARALL